MPPVCLIVIFWTHCKWEKRKVSVRSESMATWTVVTDSVISRFTAPNERTQHGSYCNSNLLWLDNLQHLLLTLLCLPKPREVLWNSWKYYQGTRRHYLSVARGEFIAIMGPSVLAKPLLLNCILPLTRHLWATFYWWPGAFQPAQSFLPLGDRSLYFPGRQLADSPLLREISRFFTNHWSHLAQEVLERVENAAKLPQIEVLPSSSMRCSGGSRSRCCSSSSCYQPRWSQQTNQLSAWLKECSHAAWKPWREPQP